ncbi:MAG TPA: protein translocase subunit SecF [Candidatus Nanoarchaeia archaeon]|nr:protein translocase subunit SecF [Candidatus Nanoarchaeia archaeon]
MSLKNKIITIYDAKYKQLLIIPMLILVLSFAQIGYQLATTGDFVNKGTSLKGGSIISISTEVDAPLIQATLNEKFRELDINVRSITDTGKQIGITIETSAQTDEQITLIIGALHELASFSDDDITVEITGSSLGRSFFRQTFTAMIIAFLLMALVVFLYFRTLVPSFAVIFAVFADIVETIAVFNITGMELTTAGIAALLMLIGYSVDTDMLLTARVLKRREGTILERTLGAYTTGMTMLATTFAAAFMALLFTNSPVVREIMTILIIGLVLDAINTWIQNAAILRWYVEKKDGHHAHKQHI